MKIGFIGAGKVSTSFGIYLNSKKISVGGYYSINKNSAKEAAQRTNSKVYDNINELIKKSDIIGITTPDDVIETIVEEILHLNKHLADKTIFHMSGAHSSDLLKPLYEQGATILSLHPMLSFNEAFNTVKELDNAYFTLEGKGEGISKTKKLLNDLGNPWIEISPENKTLYHTAATMMSNYLVTIVDVGSQMLTGIGFEKESALKMAEPLIRKTVNNIFEYGTEKALTGPIARGDISTVRKHVRNLSDISEAWLEIYKQLGFETIRIANQSGKIEVEKANKLKGELNDGDKKSYNGNIS